MSNKFYVSENVGKSVKLGYPNITKEDLNKLDMIILEGKNYLNSIWKKLSI